LDEADAPDIIPTAPPTEDVDAPALIETEEPTPVEEEPPKIDKDPAFVSASPDANFTEPEAPRIADPDIIEIAPLLSPPAEDAIIILPLTPSVLAPDNRSILPPGPDLELELAVIEILGSSRIIELALPCADEPVANEREPARDKDDDPVEIVTSPVDNEEVPELK